MLKTGTEGLCQTNGIPIANECTLYCQTDVQEKLDNLEVDNSELRILYKMMLKRDPERYLIKPSKMPNMEELRLLLPNFIGPLKDIERQLALCIESGDPVELTPLLLLGPPGVGKTHFADEIAGLLQTDSIFISMGSLTAGWVLSGHSSGWKDSKPGKIFKALMHSFYANPVVTVDEIDKAASQTQYDPLGSLYSLLEHKTAKGFIDEFVDVPIDASHIIWITTANDSDPIPKPILDRLNVHEISPPNKDQARNIALVIYKNIREGHNWGETFDEIPKDDVLDVFSKNTPRDMNGMWLTSFGNAKLAQRSFIKVEDIPPPKNKKRPIGF